jgi:hypothetical protein
MFHTLHSSTASLIDPSLVVCSQYLQSMFESSYFVRWAVRIVTVYGYKSTWNMIVKDMENENKSVTFLLLIDLLY